MTNRSREDGEEISICTSSGPHKCPEMGPILYRRGRMRRVGAGRETARWSGGDHTPRILVVGSGLIGASIALAVRRRRPRTHVAVVDRPAVTKRAVASRIAKVGFTIAQLETAIGRHEPHVIVLAAPIDGVLSAIERIATTPSRALVLDTGSVKATILERAAACGCPRFVGGHPLAGRESEGLGDATANLFEARPFVLCPGTGSRSDVVTSPRVRSRLGCTPARDVRRRSRIASSR